MDNIIKKAVEDYMVNQSSKEDDVKQPKQARHERRLTGLLNKIRSKNPGKNSTNSSKSAKVKRLQVKWHRFDNDDGDYHMVRMSQGGGPKFLKINSNDSITFSDIKIKASDLYFDDEGCNNFGDNICDCSNIICNAAGLELDEFEPVWDYVERKGLCLSKTFFIIKSQICVEGGDEKNFLDGIVIEKPVSLPGGCVNTGLSIKRKICSECHHTVEAGNECITCEQNKAFFESSSRDKEKIERTIDELFYDDVLSTDLGDDGLCGDLLFNENLCVPDLSQSNLRELRLDHFGREKKKEHLLMIHRMKVKEDLIKHFIDEKIKMDDDIDYRYIDPKGNEEAGVGSGVSRDVYSSFWLEVADSYLIGEKERVPLVRHDLYKEEWSAIGKIIVKGYADTSYFPTVLSKGFLHYCLFNELNDELLLSSFKMYLADDDKNIVEKVLMPDAAASDFISDDLLDLLDTFKCRSAVSKNNIYNIILEIARQELIQKPHLMASCWKTSLEYLKTNYKFTDSTKLNEIYEELQPDRKKVISLFKPSKMNDSEKESFGYLKRYIKGLEVLHLKRLLKFLTGSDLIIVQYIDVTFTKDQSEFTRRPIAHTCGPLLELPATYNNFCELRQEFSNILNESSWEMNIV